jgi:hypothetical protein
LMKPRHSIVLPAESIGITCVKVENIEELEAVRSMRAE